MTTIYPVIMCGGAGTRLWPLSRKGKAKQYHPLISGKTMLQETVARMRDVENLEVADPSFVSAEDDEVLIREQCQNIGVDVLRIILEPMGRNTAPLAAIVSEMFNKIDPTGLILLLPADHHIADQAEFWNCIAKGVGATRKGKLVTLGIQPSRPETGYGYIKKGKRIGPMVFDVGAFFEKPDQTTAIKYLESGDYFWNAGIFLFSPKSMLENFDQHSADILHAARTTLAASTLKGATLLLDAEKFQQSPAESIDYAIMEKSEDVAVVAPVEIGWIDIGSWTEMADFAANLGLAEPQSAMVAALDCKNTFMKTDGPLIAGIGLENLIVVAEDDKILIVPRDRAQDVKKIVTLLKSSGRDNLC